MNQVIVKKKPVILSGPIYQPTYKVGAPNPVFKPLPAYGEQDPFDLGPIEGEVPVDFDGLEEGVIKEPEAKPEPEVKTETKPDDDFPEIPESKPEPEKTEEKVPDPEPEKEKKEVKSEPEKEKTEVKKEETKKPLPTDEEIEAMKPRDNAPARDIKSHREMKEIIKSSVGRVRELETEIETLKKTAGAMTPEIEERLKLADRDRKLAEALELENDPIIRKEFETNLSKAEGDFIGFLKSHPRIALQEKGNYVFTEQKLKEIGLDTDAGRAEVNKMIAKVREATGDEMLVDEIKAKFLARAKVVEGHNQKIAELRDGGGKLIEMRQVREAEERTKWGETARNHVADIFNVDKDSYKHIASREIPEGATEAEKKEIEAHNKAVKEIALPDFHERITAVMNKDPKKSMETILLATRVPVLLKRVETVEGENKTLKDRVAELEGDAKRVRRVANPSRESSPVKEDHKFTGREQTAEEAADEFARERGIK